MNEDELKPGHHRCPEMGLRLKLKNRRVWMAQTEQGGWWIEWKRLDPENPRKIIRNHAVLSDEAMQGMLFLYAQIRGPYA